MTGTRTSETVTVALATPLEAEYRHLITDVDPRVALLVDDELLPAQQYVGDHTGDPTFRRTPDQQEAFAALLAKADIWYGVPDNSARLMGRLVPVSPRLRWVHTMAAGGGAQVRAAKLSEADLDRVTFTTSAGVHGGPLAEFAVLGVLAGAKDLHSMQRLQTAHDWPEMRWPMRQVADQTVLILGLGGIGLETARLLKAFGATVLGVRRTQGQVPGVDEVHPTEALPELVGRADAIIITLPDTHRTRHLYGADLIAKTKPGAVIVNVGRGSVIDEQALMAGLSSGQLSSAFLDVTETEPLPTDSPLWDQPNVTIYPHNAALSPHEDRLIAELFVANLSRYLAGQPMRNVVVPGEFY